MTKRVKRTDYRVWIDGKKTGIVLLQHSDWEANDYAIVMFASLGRTVSFSHYDREKNK